jgi:HEAT repeat protein
VRGKALLLIAQLGGKGDFDVLYKYLADERETVRAKAMEAIANLELKVNGSTK